MADPFSIGIAAVGSLMSAGGSIMKGMAGSQMYGYQAGIAQLNQKIALQNRDYAYAKGESDAQDYGRQARHRMGAIRAGEDWFTCLATYGYQMPVGRSVDIDTPADLERARKILEGGCAYMTGGRPAW